jgi:REP element-mobilizing transposase RayT
MVIEEPFALFITWTCYGTWLPGDSRGYVSDTLQPGNAPIPKNNAPETDYSPGHDFTRETAKKRQKFDTVWLSIIQAGIIVENLLETAHKRDWRILRGAVMRNHIHVVVTDCPDDGPGVRRILKGNAQTQLSQSQGKNSVGGRKEGAIDIFIRKTQFELVFDTWRNKRGNWRR